MTKDRLLSAFFVIVLLAIAANTYINLNNRGRIQRVERIVRIIEVRVKGVVPGKEPLGLVGAGALPRPPS